jgi:CcmD family protein
MTTALLTLLQDAAQEAKQNTATAYDTIWANPGAQQSGGLEGFMLSEDKLFVVLAVVLIIWAGIAFFVLRTDRKLDRLERTLEERIPEVDEF